MAFSTLLSSMMSWFDSNQMRCWKPFVCSYSSYHFNWYQSSHHQPWHWLGLFDGHYVILRYSSFPYWLGRLYFKIGNNHSFKDTLIITGPCRNYRKLHELLDVISSAQLCGICKIVTCLLPTNVALVSKVSYRTLESNNVKFIFPIIGH